MYEKNHHTTVLYGYFSSYNKTHPKNMKWAQTSKKMDYTPRYPGTPAKLFEIVAKLMRRSGNSPDSTLSKLC